jgi:hypothetical protein
VLEKRNVEENGEGVRVKEKECIKTKRLCGTVAP